MNWETSVWHSSELLSERAYALKKRGEFRTAATGTDQVRRSLGKLGWGVNFMVGERDEFFAELDRLTEKEIEARLDQWDQEQLALIQEYLDQRMLSTRGPQAEQAAPIEAAPSAEDTVAASLVEVASTANTKATAALIISVGAMLAAMASALVAFLALRGWTISW